MSDILDQYNAYPYPERDPADEAKRLITGSPSHPVEIDHVLYAGNRDWSLPFDVLVAGGGTGDALIQLATVLTRAGKPHRITYVDLSTEARRVAEARAKARGLTSITFQTGSLLDAAEYGQFDYIDCCGVLHHLEEPVAGLRALRAALKDEGGFGWMVYAPYGRGGVYPLQEAFGALLAGLTPQERLARARALMESLPKGHPFKLNPHVVDHKQSDAGFYDLLLHSQDRAFRIDEWGAALAEAGFEVAGMCPPALYDLGRYADPPEDMDQLQRMAMAERLSGTIRKHVGYARPTGAAPRKGAGMQAVPHLSADPVKLARAVAAGKTLPVTSQGVTFDVTLPPEAATVLAQVNGRRTLAEIARGAKTDPFLFQGLWRKVEDGLAPVGLLQMSRLGL